MSVSAATERAPGERLAFYRRLAEIWRASSPASSMSFIEYLRELARRAGTLREFAPVPDADLELFRRVVMQRPDDLRRRLLGANIQRLRALDREQRSALRALEVSPDLLSPLGELRYEPAHSRLLGYFLDQRRCPWLAGPLLGAFLELIEAPAESVEPDNVANASVSAESVIPGGRVDLRIESPALLAFVEVKIDDAEGSSQLTRYRAALDASAGNRAKVLGFLTLPDADGPPPGLTCVHITLDEVLAMWLPFARPDSDISGFLSRYLSSVARLLGYGGEGAFEQWTFADQRNALDLVSRVGIGRSRDDHL